MIEATLFVSLIILPEAVNMSPPSKPDRPTAADDEQSTYRLSKESPVAPEGIRPPPPVETYSPRRFAKTKTSSLSSRIGYNALVFLTSICVMTLELTASRLIAKHVGSSLYTWTSVIGVVLAGITLGNWLGGWMADRYDRGRSLAWMYLLASISCGSVLWLDQLAATIPRPDSFSWPQWIVTLVGMIFLLPALAMGATSPLVASMALEKSSKTGSTVGNVYAWGALGSIVGTFLTGFYLIDVWGTRSIVGMTAATLAILAVTVAGGRVVFRTAVVLGWIQLLGWMMIAANSNAEVFAAAGLAAANCLSVTRSEPDASTMRNNGEAFGRGLGEKFHEIGLMLKLRDDLIRHYHDESNYSDISVTESTENGKTIKSLKLDKLIHSYYEPANPTSLHYEYEEIYAAVTKKVAWPSSSEPLKLALKDLSGVEITADNLPKGVTLDESAQLLLIERPSNQIFLQLVEMAPEAAYWSALEQLQRETNKPAWGGFSAINLPELPEGVVIPDEIAKNLRHDESLQVLIAYQPISSEIRNRLIANTRSGSWYQKIDELRRGSRHVSACFFGGGGYIFPRWFLQEFPGSLRIDVAELDPAVRKAVTKEMGLTRQQEERIHTTIGDARNFVDDQLRENVKRKDRNESPIEYDFIYADAFNDFSVPWHLTTLEFLQKTYSLLSDQGVFQANIIDIYPRTEFPGVLVGLAEVEYKGRIPNGVLIDGAKREKAVAAAKAFAPLEVVELLTNTYRLRIPRTITPREVERLKDVTWPAVKPPSPLELTKGFQPEIDVVVERQNWRNAIEELRSLSNRKQTASCTIPEAVKVNGLALETWISAEPPYEFVEAYRVDGGKYVLGFRGVVSAEAVDKLVKLDPQNTEWVNAVTTAAAKSRLPGPGRFLGRFVATAARVFPNVYVFSTSKGQPDDSRDTFVMVCSRVPLDLKSLDETGDWTGGPFASLETIASSGQATKSGHMESILALAGGQILTDDFAPVDNLLVPLFDSPE